MICQLNSYCVDSRRKTTNHPPPYPPLFSIIHSTPCIFIYCVYFQPTLYHKSCIFAHTICMEFLSNWSSCVGWIKAKDFLTRCYGYVFCCLCDKDEPRYTIYIRKKKIDKRIFTPMCYCLIYMTVYTDGGVLAVYCLFVRRNLNVSSSIAKKK